MTFWPLAHLESKAAGADLAIQRDVDTCRDKEQALGFLGTTSPLISSISFLSILQIEERMPETHLFSLGLQTWVYSEIIGRVTENAGVCISLPEFLFTYYEHK